MKIHRTPAPSRLGLARVVGTETVARRRHRITLSLGPDLEYFRPYFPDVAEPSGTTIIGPVHTATYLPVGEQDLYQLEPIPPPFGDLFTSGPEPYAHDAVKATSRRYFTLRASPTDPDEVFIDFVLHDNPGLATQWALGANVGDPLLFDATIVERDELPVVDSYLLLGDDVALPAVAVILEQLPPSARARVILDVTDEDDHWDFDTQADVDVTWLHRGHVPAGTNTRLLHALCDLQWPNGDVYVWVMGEANEMHEVRTHLKAERQLRPSNYNINGVWLYGQLTSHISAVEGARFNDRITSGMSLGNISPPEEYISPPERFGRGD
jgi:NADPH-dependent ferric siderophore reductase